MKKPPEFAEKKLSSSLIFSGRIFNVEVDEVELPDGSRSRRECVRHSGGAAALYIKDGKVAVVRQFRYLYGREMIEIPAGKLGVGEDPALAAVRELEEETGYRATNAVRLLDIYPTPGYTDEIIHIFLVTGAVFVGAKPDKGEFLNSDFIPLGELLEKINCGEICDSKTVCAVLSYINKYNSKQ